MRCIFAGQDSPALRGEIKEDPMIRVEKPQVAEEAKPFFTEAELAALLNVTTRRLAR